MSNDFITMGERIEDLMKEKGVTQKQVAEAIKMTPGNFSKLINGENTNPKINAIIELAKYFEVSADYLLCLSNYRTPQSADIGMVTGLSDKNIETLKNNKSMLEYAAEHTGKGSPYETEFKNCFLHAKSLYFNALNIFIEILFKKGIIERIGEIHEDVTVIYQNAKNTNMQLEVVGSSDFLREIQQDRTLLRILRIEEEREYCNKLLADLLDECTDYQSSKIKCIKEQIINDRDYLYDRINTTSEEGET